jgi:pyruvate dehydrogenase E2 component (dihydrolipoyllysine-residue acetyltransferase)
MPLEIIMPKVDMDQETGTVLEWLKGEGEQVERGEALLVIETEKISMEIESPGSGILGGIRAWEGDVIPVGEVIAYLLLPDETLPADASPIPSEFTGSTLRSEIPVGSTPEPMASLLAGQIAASAGIGLAEVTGSGVGGEVTRSAGEVNRVHLKQTQVIRATPAARRRAREAGLTIETVSGSGPRGRVQQEDVEAEIRKHEESPVGNGVQVARRVPLDGMRRTISEQISKSYQQTPHISFSSRVDLSELNKVRAMMNARAQSEGKSRVSATAVFVKTTGLMLRDYPYLNASLKGDEILLWKQIHIGVAVALEDGLIVPVVKEADHKGVLQIAMELEDLISRARQGGLSLEDVTGGTFTISNLGPFGIAQFNAIINPPQSSILAIGAALEEFVPDENDQPELRPMVHMTLSVDHRIVDGAVAARFMADLKAAIEEPLLLLGY